MMSLLSDWLAKQATEAGPHPITQMAPSVFQLMKDAYSGATAPGDAYTKGMTKDEMLDRANAFAGSVAMGGSLVPRPKGSLGTFGGAGAKTADLDKLAQAETFEKAGVPADQIWTATGWGRGKDGKWRFEIDDSKAVFKPTQANVGTRETFVEHPELYAAYPDMRKGKMEIGNIGFANGMYNPKLDQTNIISKSSNPNDPSKYTPLSTSLHEFQHAIQEREGFAEGGNPGSIISGLAVRLFGTHAPEAGRLIRTLSERAKKPNKKQLEHMLYRALSGETEARNVQARRHFTPLERAIQSPWSTEDVPRRSQIPIGHTR